MRRIQRSVVCLLLFGASAGAAFALAPRNRDWHPRQGSGVEAPAPPSLLATLKNLLSRVWGRTGCEIDPYGRCQPNQAPTATPPAGGSGSTQGDTGCEIDPAGRCAASH